MSNRDTALRCFMATSPPVLFSGCFDSHHGFTFKDTSEHTQLMVCVHVSSLVKSLALALTGVFHLYLPKLKGMHTRTPKCFPSSVPA